MPEIGKKSTFIVNPPNPPNPLFCLEFRSILLRKPLYFVILEVLNM